MERRIESPHPQLRTSTLRAEHAQSNGIRSVNREVADTEPTFLGDDVLGVGYGTSIFLRRGGLEEVGNLVISQGPKLLRSLHVSWKALL